MTSSREADMDTYSATAEVFRRASYKKKGSSPHPRRCFSDHPDRSRIRRFTGNHLRVYGDVSESYVFSAIVIISAYAEVFRAWRAFSSYSFCSSPLWRRCFGGLHTKRKDHLRARGGISGQFTYILKTTDIISAHAEVFR